jgi:glycerol-3-phosphate dehydrogenase (NAD(P)+)
MKTAIIGSGSWGSALGELLVENGHETIIYGRDPAQIEDLNRNHKNSRYFPADISFDNALTGTTDLEKAVEGKDFIVISVPSEAIRPVLLQLKPLFKNSSDLCEHREGL